MRVIDGAGELTGPVQPSRSGRPPARSRLGLVALAAVLAAIVLTLVTVGIAGAQAPSQGTLTLFAARPSGAPVTQISYTSCVPRQERLTLGEFASYENAPLPGCQVALVRGGERLPLCDRPGRHVIPPAFRQSPRVVIQPGDSPPCLSPPA